MHRYCWSPPLIWPAPSPGASAHMPVPTFCSRTWAAPPNVWATGAVLALGVELGCPVAAAGGGGDVGCTVVCSVAVALVADGLGLGVGVAESSPPTTGTCAAGLLGVSDTCATGCCGEAFTCHEIVVATAATRPTRSTDTATSTPVELVSTHPRPPV